MLLSHPEQGGAPFGGAGSEYQELGLLAQTHHAHRLHHRRGQELLHTCTQPVSDEDALQMIRNTVKEFPCFIFPLH